MVVVVVVIGLRIGVACTTLGPTHALAVVKYAVSQGFEPGSCAVAGRAA